MTDQKPPAVQAVAFEDGVLKLIDQRFIPQRLDRCICRTWQQVARAIQNMVVRGAPAIGDAAAYAVFLAARQYRDRDAQSFARLVKDACSALEKARPTAVNLGWAIQRMRTILQTEADPHACTERIRREADAILWEDIRTSRSMSEHGARIVPQGARILTHCNTGSLAVSGPGTALGVIRKAHALGREPFVHVDETRPRLQGSRLTAWELMQAGIPCRIQVDSASAVLMRKGQVDLVLVGADRIAANGDTANKIGTFMLSVLARAYEIPFYVVAPVSTIDGASADGDAIEIEERPPEEVTTIGSVPIAAAGVDVYNPAFDVTPHEHITGIITEQGILHPPFASGIRDLLAEHAGK